MTSDKAPESDVTEDTRTPWQIDRDRAERPGKWPQESWGPFHRHFANDAIHRDGGPECDQPGTPRRVYVFDPDALDEHELIVARYAIAHPDQFALPGEGGGTPSGTRCPGCGGPETDDEACNYCVTCGRRRD